jgi:hypothetical protein
LGEATPEQIVQAALNAGLDAIAITDHNTCTGVGPIQEAARHTALTVFPGVEVTTSEGIHVVALLDVDKSTEDLNGLLGALKIPAGRQGQPDAISQLSAREVVEEVSASAWGGLVVLAHIEDVKGAFSILQGLARQGLFNEVPYDAVETRSGDLPEGFDAGHGFRSAPACYQASDNPDATDPTKHALVGIGTRYALLKLGPRIDLEGLRQCFIDPEVRVRKMEEPTLRQYPKIVSMKVSRGYLEDQLVEFADGLNSVIGSKGAGKSLIVEFLRFALDQASNDADIRRDHEGKLTHQLGGGAVEVTFELSSGSQYRVVRSFDECPVCVDLGRNEQYWGSLRELFRFSPTVRPRSLPYQRTRTPSWSCSTAFSTLQPTVRPSMPFRSAYHPTRWG